MLTSLRLHDHVILCTCDIWIDVIYIRWSELYKSSSGISLPTKKIMALLCLTKWIIALFFLTFLDYVGLINNKLQHVDVEDITITAHPFHGVYWAKPEMALEHNFLRCRCDMAWLLKPETKSNPNMPTIVGMFTSAGIFAFSKV